DVRHGAVVFFIAAGMGLSLMARSFVGAWEGALANQETPARIVLEISKTHDGAWKAMIHSIDQTTERLGSESVRFQKNSLRIDFDQIGSSFHGNLSVGGESMEGEWTGRNPEFLDTHGLPEPLSLRRIGTNRVATLD